MVENKTNTVNCKQARSIRELAEKEMLDNSALHHILDEVMKEKNISINQKRLKATFPRSIPYAGARRSCGKYLMSGIKGTEGNEYVYDEKC